MTMIDAGVSFDNPNFSVAKEMRVVLSDPNIAVGEHGEKGRRKIDWMWPCNLNFHLCFASLIYLIFFLFVKERGQWFTMKVLKSFWAIKRFFLFSLFFFFFEWEIL